MAMLEKKELEYLEKAGMSATQIRMLLDHCYGEAPASRRHHLAERGGLLKHSVNVTDWLLKLSPAFGCEWEDPASPYIIGMLHDLIKVATYRIGDGDEIEWTTPALPGHGEASAIMIMTNLGVCLRPQEVSCIVWHMGAYNLDRYGLDRYREALRLFPREILATHTADMLAAYVTEAE